MADKYTGGTCLLYKADGTYCKAQSQDEYDRAKAEGFQDAPPKDWNNQPDPNTPGGALPVIEVPVPPAKAKVDTPAPVARTKKDDK